MHNTQWIWLPLAAVATSAGYYSARRVHGRIVQPIVSTRRRELMPAAGSITVIAPSCTLADALTKVVYAEPARAARVLAQFGAQALLLHGLDEWRTLPGNCHGIAGCSFT